MISLPALSHRCCLLIYRCILAYLVLIAIYPDTNFAKPTDIKQAEKAVKGWLKINSGPLNARLSQQISQITPYFDDLNQTVYFAVALQPGGFVIVPADDQINPIIAFAPTGCYDPSENNPLGALVSRDLPGRVKAVRNLETGPVKFKKNTVIKLQKATRTAQKLWDILEKSADVIVTTGFSSISDVRVAPLTQSTWGQRNVSGLACYNYYTPPYEPGSSTNFYCGCVATVMAQLMRYHQYPTTGVGTPVFNITIGTDPNSYPVALLGGDGAGGPYNWSDMPLQPNSSITLTQRQAIGALCHDAGTAVEMHYTSGGSGASLYDASIQLPATFYYGNAIYGNYPPIGDDLNSMINPNLDAEYPVLLGVSRTGGAHAVVCDGYGYENSILYHHLNMGWDGLDNVWYNLPDIDAYFTYDTVHACVYNIFTGGTGEIISGRVTTSTGTALEGITITATGQGNFYATSNAQGIYALVNIPSNKTFTVTPSGGNWSFSSQEVTTGESITSTTYLPSGNQWQIDFTGTPLSVTSGDFDLDTDVDLADLIIFSYSWMSSPGDNNWNPPCDLSDPIDNQINMNDFAVFTNNWLIGTY